MKLAAFHLFIKSYIVMPHHHYICHLSLYTLAVVNNYLYEVVSFPFFEVFVFAPLCDVIVHALKIHNILFFCIQFKDYIQPQMKV